MREILARSIPVLVLVVMALCVYYVARRLSWAFSWNFWWTLLGVALVVGLCFVGMFVMMRGNYTSGLSSVVSGVANIGIGVIMLLVCSLLVMELVRLCVAISPRLFGLCAVGLASLASLYSLWNAADTEVYHVDIEIENLERPLKVAHLTDLHLGHYWGRGSVEKIVDMVEAESVDFVVITGDLFDGRRWIDSDILEPFSRLDMPIYFVEGNHDQYSGPSEIKDMVERSGIVVMANEVAEFEGVQIVGLDYLVPDRKAKDTFHGSGNAMTMEEVLPTLGIDATRPAILLHHNPVGAEYAAAAGIDLYLAGHTHAGQIFPASIVAAMMFEFNRGLYSYGEGMQVYVSQGTGTFGPPMRLGTDSELTILNLRAKQ